MSIDAAQDLTRSRRSGSMEMTARVQEASVASVNPLSVLLPASSDKVFRFLPRVEAPSEPASTEGRKRDWNVAIGLVRDASESVRAANQRANQAETDLLQIEMAHKDQVRDLEARLAAVERRAEIAQQRADEAEMWLNRYHDAIVDVFGTRAVREP